MNARSINPCLYLDWHTVIKLYPRDAPELHGEAEAVAEPQVLRHVLPVSAHLAGSGIICVTGYGIITCVAVQSLLLRLRHTVSGEKNM